MKIVSLDPDDVKTALRNNPVDVIFGAGPVTSHFFADAIAAASKGDDQPKFLEIGGAAAIAKRLPVYEATEIKKGVFGGHSPLPEDDVDTIGFSHYIVARKSLSDALAGDVTKLLFGVRQSLASDYPAIAQMTKPDTDKDAAVLAHPGAAAFIDDDQKTFFDKYSDFIYLGIMVFSGFGSGAAWLASYSRADDRIRKLRALETAARHRRNRPLCGDPRAARQAAPRRRRAGAAHDASGRAQRSRRIRHGCLFDRAQSGAGRDFRAPGHLDGPGRGAGHRPRRPMSRKWCRCTSPPRNDAKVTTSATFRVAQWPRNIIFRAN